MLICFFETVIGENRTDRAENRDGILLCQGFDFIFVLSIRRINKIRLHSRRGGVVDRLCGYGVVGNEWVKGGKRVGKFSIVFPRFIHALSTTECRLSINPRLERESRG